MIMSEEMTIVSATSDETESLIREFLEKHSTGVLATSDMSGNVRSCVVYFKVTKDLKIQFATKKETQKYKNLTENSAFSMTIYDEANQSALDISGHANEVHDDEMLQNAVNNMTQQSLEKSGRETPPAEKLEAGNYAVFQLVPLVMRLSVYARPSESEEDLFETLILE